MTDLKPGDQVECINTFGNQANSVLTAGRTYTVRDVSDSGLVSLVWGQPYARWHSHRFRKVDPEPAPPPDRGYAAGLADAVAWLQRAGRVSAAGVLEAAVDAGTVTVTAPPAPDLPTEPGTVITWTNRAYLPHLAQLDGGHARLGWRNTADDNTERWLTADELVERINGARWVRLAPAENP